MSFLFNAFVMPKINCLVILCLACFSKNQQASKQNQYLSKLINSNHFFYHSNFLEILQRLALQLFGLIQELVYRMKFVIQLRFFYKLILKRQRISSMNQTLESLQNFWRCPISNDIMIDPVITCDGQTYQRKSIQEWLKKSKTSPKTNLPLESDSLISNIVLRNMIQKFTKTPTLNKLVSNQEPLTLTHYSKEKQESIQQYLNEIFQNDQKQVEKNYNINKNLEKYGWSSIDNWKKYHEVQLSPEAHYLHLKEKKLIMHQFFANFNCDHLEYLWICNCGIDDSAWKKVIKHSDLLEKAKVFFLNRNKITDVKFKDLQKFKSLRWIDLGNNPLSEASFSALKECKKQNPQITIWVTISDQSAEI